MSLDIVCREIKNWFEQEKIIGNISISNNSITVPPKYSFAPQENQYFRIIGSVFNDGIYQFPTSELVDESFNGAVWLLAIPKDFLALVSEIEAWQEKYKDIAESPYSSESFGGYSYSKAQGYASAGGGMLSSWQAVFGSQLNKWRKI